jgi:hypothetical protein
MNFTSDNGVKKLKTPGHQETFQCSEKLHSIHLMVTQTD